MQQTYALLEPSRKLDALGIKGGHQKRRRLQKKAKSFSVGISVYPYSRFFFSLSVGGVLHQHSLTGDTAKRLTLSPQRRNFTGLSMYFGTCLLFRLSSVSSTDTSEHFFVDITKIGDQTGSYYFYGQSLLVSSCDEPCLF
jgi:hypothetical protein